MALSLGVDIGSTTIKAAVLQGGRLVHACYMRHGYRVPETLETVVKELAEKVGEESFSLCFTGTGAEARAETLGLPFLPEMDAEVKALRFFHGQVDVAIEMGGEDAKLIFLSADGTSDQRMNRMCAGGTGAFLEHLAAFLGTDLAGLDALAAQGRPLYGIASRCGVYAKTDVQALLNQGAAKADVAASVFQAVVNQVLSGLAKGQRPVGRVAFLGGPLTFLPALRARFQETLALSATDVVPATRGELFPALGAALAADSARMSAAELLALLARGEKREEKSLWMEPLFPHAGDYGDFQKAHPKGAAGHVISSFPPVVWLGMDAGSTTVKLVAVDEAGVLVYQDYARNEAAVLPRAQAMLRDFYKALPAGTTIAAAGITGYGEGFLKKAFSFDFGEVETLAHVRAARAFEPEVTALLDIGGQDMKYIRIEDGAIRQVALNGSCASGCGLFLETFAHTLGLTVEELARAAATASHRLDLGYHCTVLMNSRVHQVQRERIDTGALAAGLCTAVVKNALYRVIHLQDVSELGDKVVASGGTFANDAVLRAFEMLLGRPVVRPPYPGLMGAYGMALLARERFGKEHRSALLSLSALETLTEQAEQRRCPGCGNHCLLSLHRFSSGALYVTGNRCSIGKRLAGGASEIAAPNLAEWEKERIFRAHRRQGARGKVGIPRVLSMWRDFPFWQAFWAALGYEVVLSSFDGQALSRSAATVPQGVYCYPCRLAHGHVMELLRRDVDFLWLPETGGGTEEPELDEERHGAYGAVLAAVMEREQQAAGVPLYHPRWDAAAPQGFYDFMQSHFPKISKEEIERALAEGAEAEKSYRLALAKETRRIWDLIHAEKRTVILLLGREEQLDGEVNKGIPHLISDLGVPVLTAEGLEAMAGEGGEFSFHRRALLASETAAKNPYLELVLLQSTSCGYDGVTILEIKETLRRVGKTLTMLSLDQGGSTGALGIRIRSLLAEAAERRRHPDWREKETALSRRQPLPHAFHLAALGPCYDSLLAKVFTACGHEVTKEEGPLVSLLPEEKADLFLGLGRKGDSLPPSSDLFHRLWMALFLGDLLLRGYLAVKPVEKETGATEKARRAALAIAEAAASEGTFRAYKAAIPELLSLFENVPRKAREARPVGLLGNPKACFDFLSHENRAGISWKVQGAAEWLLNELGEDFFIRGFDGEADEGTVCLASRNTGHRALEILLDFVNPLPWLDAFNSPEEKRDALNRYCDFPDRFPGEAERDAKRRGAEEIVRLS